MDLTQNNSQNYDYGQEYHSKTSIENGQIWKPIVAIKFSLMGSIIIREKIPFRNDS